MRETKFIEQNQEKWAEFEQMLRDKNRDPDKLNDLFIQITDDLSYARTFYPNRSVRMYLNSLAQRVFHNIYRGKRFPAERLRRFWTDELPRLMWESRQALLLSFVIFVLAFVIGILSSRINPDFARVMLGDAYVETTLQNIQNGDPMAVYKESRPMGMSLGIAANNLFVALRTAIFGVLASIGTLAILLYNGIMVGAFQYFFIERGLFWESFLTIWVHGTLEIGAIIISGAAGLVAGSGLLFPGTYTRVQAFQLTMRRGLKIFIGLVPIFILAAFFEGFLTRYTDTPAAIRGSLIGASLFFMVWYFVWLPWHKARHGGFWSSGEEKELPPDRSAGIDFSGIKNAGELLSDVFTVLRRHPRTLMIGLFGATAALALTAFTFTTGKPYEVFNFWDNTSMAVLNGAQDFFGPEGKRYLFVLQIGILTVLALAYFRALEREMPEDLRPDFSLWRMFWAGLALLCPLALLPLIMRLDSGFWIWLLSNTAFPFLALWSAVLYFETSNPVTALGRTFALIRFWPGAVLGFLISSFSILLFLFLDAPVWSMIMQFFSWMVPPGGDSMRNFNVVFTTCAAALVIYLSYSVLILSGALQYFSNREIADAASLRDNIEKIGVARQIRGLARE